MNCDREGATHHLACDCREAEWQRRLDAALAERDSYRASAGLRVGMRREFEALLGCGDTTGEEAFERGLIRLRGLLAAESRAERLEAALRASVVAMKRWSAEEDGLPVAPIGAHEAVAAAESIIGYVWAGLGPDPTRAAPGGGAVSCTHHYDVTCADAECPQCHPMRAALTIAALRAENDRLRAAATYAHAVLTRLADSAAYWADYDVPVGLISEIDEAKARLAGVLS